jgi:TolA-binding protein
MLDRVLKILVCRRRREESLIQVFCAQAKPGNFKASLRRPLQGSKDFQNTLLDRNLLNFNLAKFLAALAVLLALAAPASLRGASQTEESEYRLGTNMFNDRQWHSAESKLSAFVATYTNSTHRADAILYVARSRIEQSNFVGALDLLKQEMPTGKKAPEYVYWMAAAFSGKGDYINAIAGCSNLLRNSSADPRLRLSAAFLQAQAMSKMEDWRGASDLLAETNGAFQSAARADPDDWDAVNGFFLLAEAYLQQGEYQNAEEAIDRLVTNKLTAELNWQRDYLLCRILLDAGKLDEALVESANLTALQTKSVQRTGATFLRGEILEQLHRIPEALQEYTNNLASGLPADVNRQALAETIKLSQPEDTIAFLTNFMSARPKDANLDMVRFHLGDLYVRKYFAPAGPGTNGAVPADTNLLVAAITNLDPVIHVFTNSDLLGKAYLDRGWCDWAREKYPEAATNFLQAIFGLRPQSEEKAAATFKLADSLFKAGDYTNAASYYKALLKSYDKMESVTNGLFDLALYQLVQAGVRLDDEALATNAARHILDWYPDGNFGERSLLLLGEDANQKTNYAKARLIFGSLLERFPQTLLQPDVQFAIARTYEQEGDWSNALAASSNWLADTNFTANAILRPQVEYARALDWGRAGLETNALIGMSNFVSQFPTNDLAPYAQNWIGDYHMNHAEYGDADYAYQQLYDNKKFPNAGPLAYQARLMAGYAAQHYDLPQASNDFSFLYADTNTPAVIQAEATFQLGYTDYEQFQHARTNAALLTDAIAALSRVTNGILAAQAFGQLGNCFLEGSLIQTTAADKAATLTNAGNMFQAVLDPRTKADVTARSQAEFGLGLVANRRGQPDEELMRYLELIEGDPGDSDPFFVEQAGVAAAQLEEAAGNWIGATNVYTRVKRAVPSLAADMDKYIERARAKIEASGN